MKLASYPRRGRDGKLLVVSKDLSKAVFAVAAESMIEAIENWDDVVDALNDQYRQLNSDPGSDAFVFDVEKALAPLPRTFQFVDASAFLNHGNIMEEAYDLDVKKEEGVPIMIQRQGDDFCSSVEDYPFYDESENGDFEGEVAAVLSDVPMGSDAENAESHIKLFMLLNDVSMRTHLFRELSMGFGFIHAKPATAFAPVAVTPDELGDAWQDGRVCLDMQVERNGEWFGNPNGREMDFSFGELIAHLAYNRNLSAGTVLGSGTFSNKNYDEVGSACLAERRAIEKIRTGEIKTEFLKFGETLRFEMLNQQGESLFGEIKHRFYQASKKS